MVGNLNKNNDKKICIIDTNILIGCTYSHPIKHFPTFWSQLKHSIINDKVAFLDVVVEEFKDAKEKKLYKEWVEEIKVSGKVIKTDYLAFKASSLDNDYVIIKQKKGIYKSMADTFLIAFAAEDKGNRVIITYEKGQVGITKDKSFSHNIPSVCNKLGINCTNSFEEFLDFINFKSI